MALARTFLIAAVVVFGGIGAVAAFKKKSAAPQVKPTELVEEVSLEKAADLASRPKPPAAMPVVVQSPPAPEAKPGDPLPEADRIHQLFTLDNSKLPIVETVSYTSRAPWLKGRPAWIADYASHYATSRHFIARSLNRKADYFTQKVSPGDKFNVLRRDKNINFHLLIDVSRCKMWFYYIDLDANERVLLKTYSVGLGRLDSKSASGSLTPVGKYQLGSKIAIYKPGTMGLFQDRKTEMIRIFGTRWMPFEKELDGCTQTAKGLGIHGAPWIQDSTAGTISEDHSKIGKYDSDGCIRLEAADIEELFAIIITRPTTVELVKDFHEAKLPGIERTPSEKGVQN